MNWLELKKAVPWPTLSKGNGLRLTRSSSSSTNSTTATMKAGSRLKKTILQPCIPELSTKPTFQRLIKNSVIYMELTPSTGSRKSILINTQRQSSTSSMITLFGTKSCGSSVSKDMVVTLSQDTIKEAHLITIPLLR